LIGVPQKNCPTSKVNGTIIMNDAHCARVCGLGAATQLWTKVSKMTGILRKPLKIKAFPCLIGREQGKISFRGADSREQSLYE